MRAHLIEIEAADSIGDPATLRFCSIDDRACCHLNNEEWLPAIARLPVLRYDFFDGDFRGQVATPTANFSVSIELVELFATMRLAGGTVTIYSGTLGDAWVDYEERFSGLIAGEPRIVDGLAEITASPDDAWLDKPLLDTFAGSGGVEGPDDLQGAVKPLIFGACRFVPGVLIDATNLVFFLCKPLEDVTAVYDRVASLGASTGDYADLAALLAADIPPGSWGTCLDEGLVRLGALPDGKISFDVQGENAGTGGFVRKPGAIIGRIAELAGGTTDTANLSALDTARPYNQGILLNSQVTAREVIREIAAGVAATAGITFTGTLFVQPLGLDTATEILAADGSAPMAVKSVSRSAIAAPFWRLAMPAEITWLVHDPGEVASGYNYRGTYSATRVYRIDDLVAGPDSALWAYINATPGAGNALPVWPTTSNSHWENIEPPPADASISNDLLIRAAIVSNPRTTGDVPRSLLIGEDNGSTARITIAKHDWNYPNGGAVVTRNYGTITSLSFDTDYYVYFDDATLGAASPTYYATTTFSDAINSSANPNRHYLGLIHTPANGDGPNESNGVVGTGSNAGPDIYAGLAYLNDTVTPTVNNINADNDANGSKPDAPTGVSISSVLMPDSSALVTVVWSFSPSATPSNKNSIDGYYVGLKSRAIGSGGYTYSHSDRNNAFRWVFVRPDQLSQVYEVPANREYTAVVIPIRKVMTSVNSLGEILGNVGQSSSSTPHTPTSSPVFTADIGLLGTSAATVRLYATYANAGLNSDGTVKSDKVTTQSIVDGALNVLDRQVQGGTISIGAGSGGAWTASYLTVDVVNAGDDIVAELWLHYEIDVLDPVFNEVSDFSIRLRLQRIFGGSPVQTWWSDDGSYDPFRPDETWLGASSSGVYTHGRRFAVFRHTFPGLAVGEYDVGFRAEGGTADGVSMVPYRLFLADVRTSAVDS